MIRELKKQKTERVGLLNTVKFLKGCTVSFAITHDECNISTLQEVKDLQNTTYHQALKKNVKFHNVLLMKGQKIKIYHMFVNEDLENLFYGYAVGDYAVEEWTDKDVASEKVARKDFYNKQKRLLYGGVAGLIASIGFIVAGLNALIIARLKDDVSAMVLSTLLLVLPGMIGMTASSLGALANWQDNKDMMPKSTISNPNVEDNKNIFSSLHGTQTNHTL